MTKITISPSILSADFAHLADQIKETEQAGADWLHIDVMDGHFVPNITMGPFIVKTCKQLTNLPLDLHLMIEKPEKHIRAFAEAGADRVSIHIENNANVHRTVQEIRDLGCSPAVVINPGTPASSLTAMLPFVDMVLVMSVNPGFSGQSFIPESIDKIKQIKQLITEINPDVKIQVDGGITSETLPLAYHAGAEIFVAATAIYKHTQGVAVAIDELRNSVK
jgi:ribulose-phosphate 3-epimerase